MNKSKVTKNDMLVYATNQAVRQRREDLEKRKRQIEFSEILNDWKTPAGMTTKELQEVAEIRKELDIIESLMARANYIYQKMGGEVKVEIRRSDRPGKIERVIQ